ncbi:catechol 1,2-dioxygenase [Rhizobium sp. P38BS-XIX]|uniref:VOC family protein n=1 Tax=Rhizobium sp. P38BS-XIX TaxID=2726740 RepID=UPI001456A2D9|nr:VOC family protein [Rhizobium sp. P38BS-XIX]NLR97362.1 catechol 1,2-dioxygenase [Rhizobium sp. P38BS-XIX]
MTQKLLSKLTHLVVTTPKLEESLRCYRDVIGLEVSGEQNGSFFLRGWGEHYKYSIELKEGSVGSVETIGWRTEGQHELEMAVRRLEASGNGIGWVEPNFGRGRAYRYMDPSGHQHEVFWEIERYKATGDVAPLFPNRAQKFRPRGCAVREIDHVTMNSQDILRDIKWFQETLGHKYMEYITAPRGVVFAMTTTGERGHDMALVPELPGLKGRVNHIAFWLDQRVELHRAADVLLDEGIEIEFGPGRHGLGEQEYLYFREPSGLRIEFNAGGYRNVIPDWEPVGWTVNQGANVWYKNQAMPESMFESFPSEGELEASEDAQHHFRETTFFQ